MQQLPRGALSPVTNDRMERALDAALELTFPASDPTAVHVEDSAARLVSGGKPNAEIRVPFGGGKAQPGPGAER